MSKIVIRVLSEGEESTLIQFLEKNLETSMFLYSNLLLAGLTYHGNRYEGCYAAALSDNKVIGVIAHYWNQNLVLQSRFKLHDLIKTATNVSKMPIAGFLGPVEQVSQAKKLLNVTRKQLQFDSREKLYGLDLSNLIVPSLLSGGNVLGRLANIADVELLTEWRIAYRQETMDEPKTPVLVESSHESVAKMISDKRTWLVESAGEIVATSSFNASVKIEEGGGAVQVGGVWTPPRLRGRHYGRAAVAVSLRDALADGFSQAILFTGEENIPAQKAYSALGFQEIGTYGLSFLKKALELK